MQLNGELVVVPQWLLDTVKEYGLSVSALTDLNELQRYVGFDDLVSYYSVNVMFKNFNLKMTDHAIREPIECYNNLFGTHDLIKSAKMDLNHLDDLGIRNKATLTDIQNESLVILKEYDDMGSFFNMMTTPSYRPIATNPNIYVINLFHIQDQVYGLTYKPYDGTDLDINLASLDNTMKALLTHYTYEEVCQTEIFHRWCSVIKQNQQ